MSDIFDLNISNYTLHELKSLLKLKKNYTEYNINFNSDELKKKLVTINNLNDEKKKEIANFFKMACQLLKDDLEKKQFKKMFQESRLNKVLKNQEKLLKKMDQLIILLINNKQ